MRVYRADHGDGAITTHDSCTPISPPMALQIARFVTNTNDFTLMVAVEPLIQRSVGNVSLPGH